VPAGSAPALTSFLQAVPVEDAWDEVFPGAANSWVLDANFDLVLSQAGQYTGGGALDLWVGTVTSTTAAGLVDDLIAAASTTTPSLREFPNDQTAAGATFLTPLFGPADGVVVAASRPGTSGLHVLAGIGSGFLAGSADSRLARTLPLAAGQTYTVSWTDELLLDDGTVRLAGEDAPPYGLGYQVVLRDPATGAVLADPLLVVTGVAAIGQTDRTATFSTAPGPVPAGHVDLSFELRSGAFGHAAIDAVGLATTGGPVDLPNGDFEAADLAPWRAAGAGRSQNVRSAPRIVAVDPAGAGTVAVTRTFYAPPAAAWGRMVDVVRNDGPVPVSRSLLYVTPLGANNPAVAAAAAGKAAVARDMAGLARDLGLVFGGGVAAFDASVSNFLFVVHDVTIPAHGAVAIVHFVVQLGQGGTLTGPDHATAGTDAACQAIAAGFRSDPQYQVDLEPGVLGLVQNL
jgi:hypothetical protein